MLPRSIRDRIVECLKVAEPYKVVLFGSYASGRPGKDSDIDLLVVTKEDFVPRSFRDKMALKLRISNPTSTSFEEPS
jgi:predicted nucleotidyltransferase